MKSLTLLKLKQELKLAASLIRPKRHLFRESQSMYDKRGVSQTDASHNRAGLDLWKNIRQLHGELGKLQFDFRHKHVVYCLLRGKTREQIETRKVPCSDQCAKNKYCCNKPDEDVISRLLTEYTKLISEETQNAAQGTQTIPISPG